MNAVKITVKVSRANPKQCRVELTREGKGDDLVEHRADQIEEVIHSRAEQLVKEEGGTFLKGGGQ